MNSRRLVASLDTIYLGYIEALLNQAGIEVDKRNQFIAGGLGELPVMDAMPELWVESAAYSRAEAILQQVANDPQPQEKTAWVCPQCGESIEGQFSQCWQCGYWPENNK